MAGETNNLNREVVERSFADTTIRAYQPEALHDTRVADIVYHMGTDVYESRGLHRRQFDDYTDVPVYWRLVVPGKSPDSDSETTDVRLVKAEFGVDPATHPWLERAADPAVHAKNMDDALAKFSRSEPVNVLHEYAKERMTRRLNMMGGALFAGIEQRCSFDADGKVTATWSQLVYSRHLAHAGTALAESILKLQRQNQPVPQWMLEGRTIQRRDDIARFTALSVLLHADRLDA